MATSPRKGKTWRLNPFLQGGFGWAHREWSESEFGQRIVCRPRSSVLLDGQRDNHLKRLSPPTPPRADRTSGVVSMSASRPAIIAFGVCMLFVPSARGSHISEPSTSCVPVLATGQSTVLVGELPFAQPLRSTSNSPFKPRRHRFQNVGWSTDRLEIAESDPGPILLLSEPIEYELIQSQSFCPLTSPPMRC
jgi:hypothetical protein